MSDELLARAALIDDAQLARLDTGSLPRPRRRARRLLVGGAGLAIAGALVAGPAAADYLSAHTGLFATGKEGGTGELIDLTAPDARSVMAENLGSHPLPPGETWAGYLSDRPDTIMSESVLRQQAAYYAHCRWERAWLDGVPSAQAVVDSMPGWPEFHDEGVTGDGSLQGFLTRMAAQTRQGESTLLEQDYRVNCSDGPVTQP